MSTKLQKCISFIDLFIVVDIMSIRFNPCLDVEFSAAVFLASIGQSAAAADQLLIFRRYAAIDAISNFHYIFQKPQQAFVQIYIYQ